DDETDIASTPVATQSNHYNPSPRSPEWPPWKNKTMFLADALANSRRLRFSNRALRAMLHFARECTPSDVPLLKALRKEQSRLASKLGDRKKQVVSANGNVFFMNRIATGIAQDFANPLIRKHMNFYPHYNKKRMSQVWHGSKMLEDTPNHLLTPMFRYNNKIYYVNELVCRKADWFLPQRWILHGESKNPWAIGLRIDIRPAGLHVLSDNQVAVPMSTFWFSYPELEAQNELPEFDALSTHYRSQMPHPLRSLAGKRPVYSIPLIIFMDDASGNISKLWNKHYCGYVSDAALPREVLHGESNVQFVLASPHASPLELMQGIKDDIE
ncbi:hypothetical protein FRC09_015621, partial [Ceratobasidium sp. 395]